MRWTISNEVSFEMQIKSMNQAKGERKERCLEALKHASIPPQPSAMRYFSKAHKLHAAVVIRSRCSVHRTTIITFLRGDEVMKRYNEEEVICSCSSILGLEMSTNRRHFGWELNAPKKKKKNGLRASGDISAKYLAQHSGPVEKGVSLFATSDVECAIQYRGTRMLHHTPKQHYHPLLS